MTTRQQVVTSVVAIVLGAGILWSAKSVWEKKAVIRRRIAPGKAPPPKTAEGKKAAKFLASLSDDQKAKIERILTLWQKWDLFTVDEDNPEEMRQFVLSLSKDQRASIRKVLSDEQNSFIDALMKGRPSP